MTINDLKKGQQAIIKDINCDKLPLKLLELGCLPGNLVQLLEKAPFDDPIYLNINETFLAIRKEFAQDIEVELISSYEK